MLFKNLNIIPLIERAAADNERLTSREICSDLFL